VCSSDLYYLKDFKENLQRKIKDFGLIKKYSKWGLMITNSAIFY